jgi:adenylosuccinate synthase
VGWLDLVALKYAIMINGVDQIFLTKLDVLDAFDEIKVVTAYRVNGKETEMFNPSGDYLENVQPICQSFPGWKKDTSVINHYHDLPGETQNYITFIENFTGVPFQYISVGTGRHQTIKK